MANSFMKKDNRMWNIGIKTFWAHLWNWYSKASLFFFPKSPVVVVVSLLYVTLVDLEPPLVAEDNRDALENPPNENEDLWDFGESCVLILGYGEPGQIIFFKS